MAVMSRRQVWRGMLVLLMIISSFRCAAPPPTPPSEPPRPRIKIGYVPIADCLPLYIGVDKGIFTKHGLDIEIMALQSGQRIIEALIAGELQAGIANVVSTMTAHARGVPLVSITGGAMEVPDHLTRALLVPAGSSIKNAAQLAGKTIAVNGLRNIEHVKLRQYLELHKVDVDKVKVVEAPFPQMEGVLMNKSVDGAMAIEPFLSLAVKHGTVRIIGRPYVETSDRTHVSSYVVLKSWLDTNDQAARAFANAIGEATAYIGEHAAESRQIVIKYTKLPEEVANEVQLPLFEPRFNGSELQPMADELVRQGVLQAPIKTAEVFRRY
jgi:NitT/TauT family transport system substrate-binding protein